MRILLVGTYYTLEHKLPSGWVYGRLLGTDADKAQAELGSARAMNPDVEYRVMETTKEPKSW